MFELERLKLSKLKRHERKVVVAGVSVSDTIDRYGYCL
jgi:hypothetical protein